MAPIKDKNETMDNVKVMAFPPGMPRPHQARNWGRSLQSVLAHHGLTDIILDQIPASKFEPLFPEEGGRMAIATAPAGPSGPSP